MPRIDENGSVIRVTRDGFLRTEFLPRTSRSSMRIEKLVEGGQRATLSWKADHGDNTSTHLWLYANKSLNIFDAVESARSGVKKTAIWLLDSSLLFWP